MLKGSDMFAQNLILMNPYHISYYMHGLIFLNSYLITLSKAFVSLTCYEGIILKILICILNIFSNKETKNHKCQIEELGDSNWDK